MKEREWLDREPKLELKSEPGIVVRLFQVSKEGKPYVEYIQSSKDAFYLAVEGDKLKAYDKLVVEGREAEISKEWKRLTTAGVISCPSDAKGPHEPEEVFEAIREWLGRVVVVPFEAARTAMTAYAMMSWFTFRYDALPYLRFIGDFGSGKTTALRAMSAVCYRAMNISGVTTPATLFRLIEAARGTLAMDEADLDRTAISREIVKILNHGYCRGVAVVRLDKRNKPQAFEAFGPKLVAARGELGDDALGSRCLDVRMERARAKVDPVDGLDIVERAAEIQKALLFMRFQFKDTEAGQSVFRSGSAKPYEGLTARVRQLAQPIFDFTPAARQKEIADFFEAVNIGAEAVMRGTEGELRQILRRAAANDSHVLQINYIYAMLSPTARKRHTKKAVSRMLEAMGTERRHGREGTYVTGFDLGI